MSSTPARQDLSEESHATDMSTAAIDAKTTRVGELYDSSSPTTLQEALVQAIPLMEAIPLKQATTPPLIQTILLM